MLHLRLATPFSYLWVCPDCSTTWCVADSLFPGKPHLFIHALCQPCGGGELTADYWIDQDSLLDTTLDHLLTHLSYDQLIREATLYLEELFDERNSPADFDTATCTVVTRFVHSEGSESPP